MKRNRRNRDLKVIKKDGTLEDYNEQLLMLQVKQQKEQ